MTNRLAAMRCPACGRRLHTVHVHGHGQCAFCATPIEPCCSGAGDEADAQPWAPPAAIDEPGLRKVFAGLGGPRATVAHDALALALSRRLGGTLDDAEKVLAELLAAGLLVAAGPGAYRLARSRRSPAAR